MVILDGVALAQGENSQNQDNNMDEIYSVQSAYAALSGPLLVGGAGLDGISSVLRLVWNRGVFQSA